MSVRRAVASLMLCLLLSACSGAALLDALVPQGGYRLVPDLAYRDGPRGRLDIYVPDAPADAAPSPVVVFFYGGGWETGSKADYRFVGEALTARGYTVAIPDYRLYPQVRFPGFLEDAAAAVTWLRRHGPAGDRPVYLLGHSAGAYIAAMLTLDRRWLARTGDDVCRAVAATVGLAGPYDFLPLRSASLRAIFGPGPAGPETQPINRVDGKAPPMLLVTGGDDTTVLPGNSDRLAARIAAAGGLAERRSYDRIGHIALVASLASPLQGLSPAIDDVDAFLRRHPADRPGRCGGGSTGSSSSASPASPPAPSRGG